VNRNLLNKAITSTFEDYKPVSDTSIEDCFSNFVKIINECKKKATLDIKRNRHENPEKPWMNSNILDLIAERD